MAARRESGWCVSQHARGEATRARSERTHFPRRELETASNSCVFCCAVYIVAAAHKSHDCESHRRGGVQPGVPAASHLVVAAVDLALGIQNAAPVRGVEALLGVDVEKHLHLAARVAALEGLQLARRLQLAGEGANQRRRRAPRAHKLAGLQVEGRAVEGAHDGAVLHGALIERRADVRAHVGSSEDLAATVGGDEDVLAGTEARLERRRLRAGGGVENGGVRETSRDSSGGGLPLQRPQRVASPLHPARVVALRPAARIRHGRVAATRIIHIGGRALLPSFGRFGLRFGWPACLLAA